MPVTLHIDICGAATRPVGHHECPVSWWRHDPVSRLPSITTAITVSPIPVHPNHAWLRLNRDDLHLALRRWWWRWLLHDNARRRLRLGLINGAALLINAVAQRSA